jgi:5-methylcytosine-specific restriction enzyme A
VHHIKPFHLFPDLELSFANLITLGEACPTGNHHLLFGHLGYWSSWNEDVVKDARTFRIKIQTRPLREAA